MRFDLEERKLHIRVFLAPCSCRCRFCCYGQYNRSKRISFAQYTQVLQKFSNLKQTHGIEPCCFVYNSLEYPELPEQIRLSKELGYPYENVLNMNINGTKIRHGVDLEQWVLHLKELGAVSGMLSFFGLEETHDAFSGRKGYFCYLKECSDQLRKQGIRSVGQIFLHRGMLHEVQLLAEHLKAHCDEVRFLLMEYLGNAKNMLSEFLTQQDFDNLPDSVRAAIPSAYRQKLKTEKEWVSLAQQQRFPSMRFAEYVLFLTPENIDWVLQNDVDTILDWFREKNRRLQDSIPSMEALASQYGDVDNLALYDCRDVLRKWLDQYYQAEGLDSSLLYTDVGCSVEWKAFERLLS